MAIEGWKEDKSLGETPCETDKQSWKCHNMVLIRTSEDARYDTYLCTLCSKRETVDWDECK